MAMVELHCNGAFLAKLAMATIGNKSGDKVAFLVAGPIPEFEEPQKYELVVEGKVYPVKGLKVEANGKTVSGELL